MKSLDSVMRPSRPEFDVHLTANVPVAMRDGARLATDVYRPARDGQPLTEPRPVRLHRAPYNKTETESVLGECRWFAARGYALNLTDSIVRLRYRNGLERGEPAAPGVSMQVTITLYPTSNLFMPGHRIRLDISSSNHPRCDVNPNTGEPIGRDRCRVVADNTVFHERGRESRIVLPIIPPAPSHP